MDISQQAEAILYFWFGALDDAGWIRENKHPLWFGARPQDDALMRENFGALIGNAIAGELNHWETHSDASNMALLLLSDQMTRAVHRATALAFAGDGVALRVCKNGVRDSRHRRLKPAWRRFYYLPLEHSECLNDQNDCVALFEALVKEFPQHEKNLADIVDYALQHRELIERFGRFPHRNRVLGRKNTEEEEDFLASSAQHFGQKK